MTESELPINQRLNDLVSDFDIQTGEIDMLLVDANYIDALPTQTATAIVATSNAKTNPDQLYGTVGLCKAASSNIHNQFDGNNNLGLDRNNLTNYGFYYLSTITEAGAAFSYHHSPLAMETDYDAWAKVVVKAEIQLLELPKHGTIKLQNGNTGNFDLEPVLDRFISDDAYGYKPDSGYVGPDKVVFLVKMGDYKVKVVYYLKVVTTELTKRDLENGYKKYCPKTIWQISASSNGMPITATLDSQVDNITDGTYSLSLPAAFLGSDYASPTFTNLTGAAVGETKGEGADATITLDTDAAGYGWYIDYTPYLNEAYLSGGITRLS